MIVRYTRHSYKVSKANKLEIQKSPSVKSYIHAMVMLRIASSSQTTLPNSSIINISWINLTQNKVDLCPQKTNKYNILVILLCLLWTFYKQYMGKNNKFRRLLTSAYWPLFWISGITYIQQPVTYLGYTVNVT